MCDDHWDNDQDGLKDCDDPDCAVYTVCLEIDCSDGLDNDKDGPTDCLDPNCEIWCNEDCEDGIDNDADGLIDCYDDECEFEVEPCLEVCDDGVDGCEDGFAIRVLSGHIVHRHSGGSSDRFRWWVQSPQGIAHIGESSEHISCTWSASSFTLSHWGAPNRSTHGDFVSWHVRQDWLINSLQTSGGCSGRLTSAMLSFESSGSSRPMNRDVWGGYGSMTLDGTRL